MFKQYISLSIFSKPFKSVQCMRLLISLPVIISSISQMPWLPHLILKLNTEQTGKHFSFEHRGDMGGLSTRNFLRTRNAYLASFSLKIVVPSCFLSWGLSETELCLNWVWRDTVQNTEMLFTQPWRVSGLTESALQHDKLLCPFTCSESTSGFRV